MAWVLMIFVAAVVGGLLAKATGLEDLDGLFIGLALIATFTVALFWSGRPSRADRKRAAEPVDCAMCAWRGPRGQLKNHSCSVVARAAKTGATWYSTTWGSVPYWVGIAADRKGEVWRCTEHDEPPTSNARHPHEWRRQAVACAAQSIRYNLEGGPLADIAVAPMPRPDVRPQRLPIADLSADQWRTMIKSADFRCDYCEQQFDPDELQKEHVVPLARGGANSIINIVPSCGPCNREKGTMTGDEYREFRRRLQSRGTP